MSSAAGRGVSPCASRAHGRSWFSAEPPTRFGRTPKVANVVFVQTEDVERAHARAVARFGGQDGVRDRGLLESAVMAPRTGYYASLAA